MLRYILKRILWCIPVMFCVVFFVFAIDRLVDTGDAVAASLGGAYTEEQYEAREAELGLDKPFFVQFGVYMKNLLLNGDMGTSYNTKRPVAQEIAERFPTTIRLAIFSILLAIILGIPLGVISAVKQYSIVDYASTVGSLIFAAMPSFWLALILMLGFALNIKLFPASGLGTWKHWVLPTLASGLAYVATLTRMTRSSMHDVIREDYIRTARSKGLGEGTIIFKHALKNALIPVITVVGGQFGGLVGGSVIVETIFALPGIGTLLMESITGRDYPVTEGCVIVLAVLICAVNLFVDISYCLVDPRIMAQYRRKPRKKNKLSTCVESER